MRIVTIALLILIVLYGRAEAQYYPQPGPWMPPAGSPYGGHPYYVPRYEGISRPRWGYYPPRNWYGPPPYNSGIAPRPLPRINCYANPWACPGPP